MTGVEYLSRYLYRGVVSQSSLVAMDRQRRTMTFRYIDSGTGEPVLKTLSIAPFLWWIVACAADWLPACSRVWVFASQRQTYAAAGAVASPDGHPADGRNETAAVAVSPLPGADAVCRRHTQTLRADVTLSSRDEAGV